MEDAPQEGGGGTAVAPTIAVVPALSRDETAFCCPQPAASIRFSNSRFSSPVALSP
jgi:hypothetical protein